MSPKIDDLSSPLSLLTALWDARYGAACGPQIFETYWERDKAIVERLYPRAFTMEQGWGPAEAMRELIREVSGGKRADDHYDIPRGWFTVFHAAYRQALITELAWGMAARITYQARSGGPTEDAASVQEALDGLRDADPMGMMDTEEAELWLSLPATMTLYRGSCTASQQTVAEGVSWTNSPNIAAAFAERRLNQRAAMGMAPHPPRITQAVVPRAAVLAVLKWGDQIEYLVDYEMLSPALTGNRVFSSQLNRMRSAFAGL